MTSEKRRKTNKKKKHKRTNWWIICALNNFRSDGLLYLLKFVRAIYVFHASIWIIVKLMDYLILSSITSLSTTTLCLINIHRPTVVFLISSCQWITQCDKAALVTGLRVFYVTWKELPCIFRLRFVPSSFQSSNCKRFFISKSHSRHLYIAHMSFDNFLIYPLLYRPGKNKK